ncbi:MAG: VCBS domain-containing protein, partial [Pseudorhodoplanes sp.]
PSDQAFLKTGINQPLNGFTIVLGGNNGIPNLGFTTFSVTDPLPQQGTNHAPVANADVGHVKAAGVLPGSNIPTIGSPFSKGNVLSNDTDADAASGDTKTVTGVKSGTSTGGVSGDVGSIIVGTYGFLILQADGKYLYTLNNFDPDTIKLHEGEPRQDVFTYTTTDSHGLTSSTTLTIDVTGTNNAPFILHDHTSGTVTEDQPSLNTASGTLTKGDADNDDSGANDVWSAIAHSGQSQNGATSIDGKYGTFVIDQDGKWTYTLDNSLAATQALNNGDHPTETFNVKVTDSHGASAIETISVRVNGSDDAPTLGNVNAGTL